MTAQGLLTRVGIKFGDPAFVDVQIPPVSAAAGYTPVSAAGSAAGSATGPAPESVPAPVKPTALPGTVVTQSPPVGYRVDVGATVLLTVAK